MSISEAQKRQLKKLGHSLKPVIMIGANGLTDAVCAETEIALDHHELIKVKIAGADRDDRDAMITEMCKRTKAELIQRVGNVALIFRRNAKKPKIQF